MRRERLLLWSAACLPGVHLPLFAARAEGLDVDLVESAPGPDRVRLLADGAGDFLLTATLYHLQALDQAGDSGLPVRSVAVVHRRSPVAALVRADSPFRTAADLVGRRLGAPVGRQMGWLAVELQAALAGPVEVVDLAVPDCFTALAAGEVDLVANFAELAPLDRRRTGTDLRTIPVGPAVHTSSLLAGAGVSDERVERMVGALRASFELQQADPQRGTAELCSQYPSVDPAEAVESWRDLEPYVFGGPDGLLAPGSSSAWQHTLEWSSAVHGLRQLSVTDVVGARAHL